MWPNRRPLDGTVELTDHLRRIATRPIRVGPEALRTPLIRYGTAFQRTSTWKECIGPNFDAGLDQDRVRDQRAAPGPGFPFAELCLSDDRMPDITPAEFDTTLRARDRR